MAPLHYLTLQDVLWINLQVTKEVQSFDYARLEEATFYQYAYGDSNTLFDQAARFVTGFVKMQPFAAGNDATALVACLGFLLINGQSTTATGDAIGAWFRSATSQGAAMDSFSSIVVPAGDHGHALIPDVRKVFAGILEKYSELVESLGTPSAA